MNKYEITLEIETDLDPREWTLGEVLIIDEPYQITQIKEANSRRKTGEK
jgi:hypothetical protein